MLFSIKYPSLFYLKWNFEHHLQTEGTDASDQPVDLLEAGSIEHLRQSEEEEKVEKERRSKLCHLPHIASLVDIGSNAATEF